MSMLNTLVLKSVTPPVIAFSTLLMSFSSYAGAITEDTAGSDYSSSSSQKVTSSPFVRFIAFSQSNNGDASSSADFALTLDAEDLVYFSKFKQDTTAGTGYITLAAAGPILFPVATFQMCVESNVKDLASNNYLKASVTNNQLSGLTNTSSNINLYVMLVGNGSGTNSASATQYCTFGTAASTIQRYANSTAVSDSTGVLATATVSTTAASLMTNAWTTASGGVDAATNGTFTNVTVGQTGHCKLLHYGVSSTNTNPSSAAVSDPDGTDYEVDISTFTANTCGTSNANAVTAYVYADIRDFQSVPADTYSGNIEVGFSYATS